jgi:transposase
MARHDRLTPEQRAELGQAALSGTSITRLAKKYKCTRAVVRRWREEAKQARPQWADAARSGAPRALDAAEHKAARRSALAGHTAVRIAASLNRKRTKHVSAATVRRTLKRGRTALKWLPLEHSRTLSDANKTARAQFARDHAGAQTSTWMFADSKPFYLYPDGSGGLRFAWQQPDAVRPRAQCSNPTVLHVYAVVARGRKSRLIFTAPSPPRGSKLKKSKEKFSARHFKKVAKELASTIRKWGMDGGRYKLVLDGATQHTAQGSRDYMQELGLHLLQGYPAQSWDINIIENVWGILDTKLNQLPGRMPDTPGGWRRRLQRAWDLVSQSSIDKLVKQVPNRLAQIAEKEGAWLFPHKAKRR